MIVRTGFDTGVFVLHAGKDPAATRLWLEAAAGEREGVVSGITLFELDRLALRGTLPVEYAEAALLHIPTVCSVVWPQGLERIRSAARLGHGLGLSLADTFVLSAFVETECREAYTTDGDLLRWQGRGLQVHRLGPT